MPWTGRRWLDKLAIVGVILAGAANATAAYFILNRLPAVRHVEAVIFAAVFFMIADYVISKQPLPANQRADFRESFLIADIPVVGGLGILWIFLMCHANHETDQSMEYFVAGAITFQLVASNLLFVLSQGGFVRRPYRRVRA
jgi:hypothetical protein